MNEVNEVNEWSRMPREPMRWFARFERYRLAGPRRSLLRVYNQERHEREKDGKSATIPGAWQEAAERWCWRERAQGWDEAQLIAEAEEWTQRRRAQRENDWALSQALATQAALALSKFDATTATASDICRLAETANKLARLACEMETDRLRVEYEPIDWSQVPREITDAFVDRRIGLDDVLRYLRRRGGA